MRSPHHNRCRQFDRLSGFGIRDWEEGLIKTVGLILKRLFLGILLVCKMILSQNSYGTDATDIFFLNSPDGICSLYTNTPAIGKWPCQNGCGSYGDASVCVLLAYCCILFASPRTKFQTKNICVSPFLSLYQLIFEILYSFSKYLCIS